MILIVTAGEMTMCNNGAELSDEPTENYHQLGSFTQLSGAVYHLSAHFFGSCS